MNKSIGLEKVKVFDPKDIAKVAAIHLRYFKDRVFSKGKDKDDKQFKGYSENYTKIKSRGFTTLKGDRYKSHTGQPISSTQTAKVDLTVTGKLNKATHVYDFRSDGYRIGWHTNRTDNVQNNKIVEGQKEQGRDILGCPESEMKKVANEVERQFEKHLKLTLKDVSITVG